MNSKLITRKELIAIYHEKGANNTAEHLGCSKTTLYKLLREAEIPLQTPHKTAFRPDFRIKLVEE